MEETVADPSVWKRLKLSPKAMISAPFCKLTTGGPTDSVSSLVLCGNSKISLALLSSVYFLVGSDPVEGILGGKSSAGNNTLARLHERRSQEIQLHNGICLVDLLPCSPTHTPHIPPDHSPLHTLL